METSGKPIKRDDILDFLKKMFPQSREINEVRNVYQVGNNIYTKVGNYLTGDFLKPVAAIAVQRKFNLTTVRGGIACRCGCTDFENIRVFKPGTSMGISMSCKSCEESITIWSGD